jgi:hypothetical protein
MDRPPLPPFTVETAEQKARIAEDAWNSRDPGRVALAYAADSRWRNRAEMFQGSAARRVSAFTSVLKAVLTNSRGQFSKSWGSPHINLPASAYSKVGCKRG